MSLGGMAVAIGLVVDDAIVMLENIVRHMEAGEKPLEASLKGSQEIGFTILTMTTSLAAVFIPILFMSGILGRLFREFAVTLSVAIFVSLLISLTTTPMMCATLLRPHGEQRKHGRLYQASERGFQWIHGHYESSLAWVLRHQPLTLLVTLLTMGASVYLYVIVPKGFFPQQDTGRLTGSVQADQSSSFQAMQPRLARLAAIVAVGDIEGMLIGERRLDARPRAHVGTDLFPHVADKRVGGERQNSNPAIGDERRLIGQLLKCLRVALIDSNQKRQDLAGKMLITSVMVGVWFASRGRLSKASTRAR